MLVLTIYCAVNVPGVKFGYTLGVYSLHRRTIGNKSKFNISKTSKGILIKSHTQHHWTAGRVAYCLWLGRTGILVSMATYVLMDKNKQTKFLVSETTGPTALIFGMWQWLMVLYINCASYAPRVKFGLALEVDSLHKLQWEKLKKSSSLIPQGLLYFICSIVC